MRPVRIAISLLALAAAPVLAVQGMANSRQFSGAMPLNGFWQANIARQMVGVTQDEAGMPQMAVRPGGLDLARDAFAREPLAMNAVFLMAIDARQSGDTARANRIVELGAGIDKRNRYLAALQVEAALPAQDFDAALAAIERIAATNPALSGGFVNAFTVFLAQDGAVPVLQAALEREPAWAAPFWLLPPSDPLPLRRLYELRLLTDVGTSAQSDARLLAALTQAQLYAEAFALWDTMPQAARNPSGFAADGAETAFEWQAPAGKEGNFSQRGEGNYQVFVDERATAELARRLVRLTPGRYTFAADFSPEDQANDLQAKLECATGGSGGESAQSLAEPVAWTVGAGCSIYWLILSGDAYERRSPIEGTVSNLRLEATG